MEGILVGYVRPSCTGPLRRGERTRPPSESSTQAGAWSLALPAAHLTIHAGSDEPTRDRRAEQQMVDAQAGVADPCVPEVVPKGVDAFVGVKRAQSVGPALRNEFMKGGAHLRAEQGIVEQRSGL